MFSVGQDGTRTQVETHSVTKSSNAYPPLPRRGGKGAGPSGGLAAASPEAAV